MSTLSERIAQLEAVTAQLSQDVLLRPDLNLLAEYQQTINQQLSQISTAVNQVIAVQRTIQNLCTAVRLDVANLTSSFTGHTGASLSGSSPAHGGT